MSINKFRSIILSGGNYCFVKCPGCYNHSDKQDYKTDNLLFFLRELKKCADINKVTVAGGDPLIRNDICIFAQTLGLLWQPSF